MAKHNRAVLEKRTRNAEYAYRHRRMPPREIRRLKREQRHERWLRREAEWMNNNT